MERSMPQQTTTNQIIPPESYLETGRATWRDYIEITKPGINKTNLLATFAGYWIAAGFTSFDFLTFFFTMLGTGLIIAGGCTINNFYDRDIDPRMERTRKRAIPEGRIKPAIALWYGITLTILGILILAIGVNALAAFLGLMGFYVYVIVYTMWLKRTSTLNTVIGGICGAIPPLIGWAAVNNSLDLSAWALFLILFMWQPPHFFALAMRKVDDYRRAGIPMLPVVKGFAATKKQTLFFTLLLLPSSLILFFTGVAGWIYFVVALILGLIYIALSIKGFFAKDDDLWAKQMFFYSLIYITLILFVMIVDVAVMEIVKMY
ncbi:heme o synthase [Thermoflavimicrobium dichotomicum]|uniref:Protoheme IX farnesyltransferase n=1 Tax=Thermoflavimicrobium dichotomicum TaxID=46223 RepID=A0A1I3JDU7_9BACL|nr:heme o synthase [Thermoflavimicrobium dichotomicum]SFI58447.1 protoheme IX farnesyltransferase [Thermoflavimicrobium dichotomicum]